MHGVIHNGSNAKEGIEGAYIHELCFGIPVLTGNAIVQRLLEFVVK